MRTTIFTLGMLWGWGTGSFLFAQEKANPKPLPRVPWTTSRVIGSPDPPPPFRVERVYPQLTFSNPVSLVASPHGDRLFLSELAGTISSFPQNSKNSKPDVCFDAKKAIPGLRRIYSFTFHPQFRKNRFVYLCYVTEDQNPTGTHVSRFQMRNTNPPTIDPATETVLIQWRSGGHNGGCLKFGPDGYLYITTGDASPPNPPDIHQTGQSLDDLLAAILRIDVDQTENGKPYRIPEDNPFVGQENTRPEIWSYGFRNPWKMSFDPQGNLWVGDVGWELWEMIFRVERGGNYGWSVMEGPQPVRTENKPGPTPIIPATVAHSHIESRSITGGFVYRGKSLPELKGSYIYGDYVTGKIWSLPFDPKTKAVGQPRELVDSPLQIITFGEDADGELLIVDYHGGIYRLANNSDREPNKNFPAKLSETGLFQMLGRQFYSPAPGVLSYQINHAPWEDGAIAKRYLAIPGAPTLEMYTKSDAQIGFLKGQWKYPSGTVFVKTLSLPINKITTTKPLEIPAPRIIETQILHYDEDTWRAYTYAWNKDQTDAELVPAEGRNETFLVKDFKEPGGMRKHEWRFASRTECIVCHVTRAGSVLGFQLPQLDALPDKNPKSQIHSFTKAGVFQDPSTELKSLHLKPEAVYPDPIDETAPLAERARTYLHVNCAHCHRRGGGGTAPFELLSSLPLEKTDALAARPTQGTFDLYAPEVISPGDPYRSVLYHRMATLGKGRMPHLGSHRVDESGLKLIHDWIASLPAKPALSEADKTRQILKAGDEKALGHLKNQEHLAGSLDHLLGSTSGALMLMHTFANSDIPKDTRALILTRIRKTEAPIRGLFERFLPQNQRTKTLGTAIKPEALLAMSGEAERGRKLFLTAAGVSCRNCHQIGNQGKELGPKLDGIGKKLTRKQLLESILEPSKKIDPKFVSYLMETSQGQVYSGLLVKRTTKEVILKDSAGKLITHPADQVEQFVPQRKSLMPELLLKDLTAAQVADLLAFLESLK